MNSNGHKSILIVDDEEDICTLLKRILEMHKPDYRVMTATHGLIAIVRLMKQEFDLVLTDWHMGDMDIDGFELAGIIRDIAPDTRILLMTGRAAPDFDGAVKSLGLKGWLEKPFTPTHVLNVIDQAIVG